MTDVSVKLSVDTVSGIILNDLKETLDSLERDLESRKSGNGFAIFDHDQQTDVKIIEKHVNAVKIVMSYYGYKDYENL